MFIIAIIFVIIFIIIIVVAVIQSLNEAYTWAIPALAPLTHPSTTTIIRLVILSVKRLGGCHKLMSLAFIQDCFLYCLPLVYKRKKTGYVQEGMQVFPSFPKLSQLKQFFVALALNQCKSASPLKITQRNFIHADKLDAYIFYMQHWMQLSTTLNSG